MCTADHRLAKKPDLVSREPASHGGGSLETAGLFVLVWQERALVSHQLWIRSVVTLVAEESSNRLTWSHRSRRAKQAIDPDTP